LKLNQKISFSRGWARRAIAWSAGAVGALSLAPINFTPAVAVTFVVAVLLVDGVGAPMKSIDGERSLSHRIRDAFQIGWWLGFGYFVAGLWWLGAAFLVDAAEFAWALPLGVAGLPAILACFTGLGCACAYLFWSAGPSRILVLALSLAASEWLRSVAFTGFPWNDFGMALGGQLILAQAASVVGLHGLTLLSVAIFASPATLFDAGPRRDRIVAPIIGLLCLAILFTAGGLRLWLHPTMFDDDVRLRIVQPNTPQDEDFRPDQSEKILAHYFRVSRQVTAQSPRGLADVTHVVWPESAFPFFLSRNPGALSSIARAMENATLITGAARVEAKTDGELPGEIRSVAYYNSIQAIGHPDGRILDSYDKMHLVPFGEYLPFSGLLESIGLRQFVQIPGGFEAGANRKLLDVPGLPKVFPLVCYEAIFPGTLDPDMRRQAGLILNVSNDGWFGMTAGPHQHLAQARLRSIEEGLPMVRAANTGMSAIIDAYGRFIGQLDLGVEGVLDAKLPRAAPMPMFAKSPLLAPVVLFLLCGLLLLGVRLRRLR
jgi:apolipoprotein N-acyltransferase